MIKPDSFSLNEHGILMRNQIKQGCPYSEDAHCGDWCPHFRTTPKRDAISAYASLRCAAGGNLFEIKEEEGEVDID